MLLNNTWPPVSLSTVICKSGTGPMYALFSAKVSDIKLQSRDKTRNSLNGDLEHIYRHIEGNHALEFLPTSLTFALTDRVRRDRRIWCACPSSYQFFFWIFSSTIIPCQSSKH